MKNLNSFLIAGAITLLSGCVGGKKAIESISLKPTNCITTITDPIVVEKLFSVLNLKPNGDNRFVVKYNEGLQTPDTFPYNQIKCSTFNNKGMSCRTVDSIILVSKDSLLKYQKGLIVGGEISKNDLLFPSFKDTTFQVFKGDEDTTKYVEIVIPNNERDTAQIDMNKQFESLAHSVNLSTAGLSEYHRNLTGGLLEVSIDDFVYPKNPKDSCDIVDADNQEQLNFQKRFRNEQQTLINKALEVQRDINGFKKFYVDQGCPEEMYDQSGYLEKKEILVSENTMAVMNAQQTHYEPKLKEPCTTITKENCLSIQTSGNGNFEYQVKSTCPQGEKISYSVHDMTGKSICSGNGLLNQPFNLEACFQNIGSGMFVLKIVNGSNTTVQKIVK